MKILSISDALTKKMEQRKRLYEALVSVDNSIKRVKLTRVNDEMTTSIISMLLNVRSKLKAAHDKLGQ